MFNPEEPDEGSHPTLTSPRQGVLLSIIAEVDRPISTTELARLVGQSLGATAHHVRALARQGLIEWAGERRVRGALQTFYVPSDAGMLALRAPRIEALLTLFGTSSMLVDEGSSAAVELDEGAHEELRRVIEDLRPRVERIVAAAAARRED
jgi:hypothetical protein